MGRPFRVLLNADKVYACGNCRTHLASSCELESKHFHCKTGRAYLFHTCCNVVGGAHEQRMMTTGKHVVCDIYCVECMSCVGWQYIFAFEEHQKYKEGMCILERAMVVDFDKTSPAASLARASLSLSSCSTSSSPTCGSGSESPPSQQQLQLQLQQARMLTGMGSLFYSPHSLESGSGLVLFAADDSGSEDDE